MPPSIRVFVWCIRGRPRLDMGVGIRYAKDGGRAQAGRWRFPAPEIRQTRGRHPLRGLARPPVGLPPGDEGPVLRGGPR